MPPSRQHSASATSIPPSAQSCAEWRNPFSAAARTSLLTACSRVRSRAGGRPRSEEHTSELQSQSNLVCRLLLEKKKNNNALCTPQDLLLLAHHALSATR